MSTRYLLFLLVVLIMLAIGVSAKSEWIISDNYQISYVENIAVDLGNTHIKEQERPHSIAAITVTTDGYNYVGLESYLDHEIRNVTFASVLLPDEGVVYVPTGDFPIVLPTQLNTQTNWIENFAATMRSNSVREYALENASFHQVAINLTTDKIIFHHQSKIDYLALAGWVNLPKYAMYNSLMVNELHGIGGYFTNASVLLDFAYSLKSGVLFDYNLTLIAHNYIDSSGNVDHHPFLNQQLLFAIVLPPINSESISMHSIILFLPILAVLQRFRR